MVCTNLSRSGRGTSPCDRRKSQGRLPDGPLRNWFLLSSLSAASPTESAATGSGSRSPGSAAAWGWGRGEALAGEGRLWPARDSAPLGGSGDRVLGAKRGSPPAPRAAGRARLHFQPFPPLLSAHAQADGSQLSPPGLWEQWGILLTPHPTPFPCSTSLPMAPLRHRHPDTQVPPCPSWGLTKGPGTGQRAAGA